MRLPDASRGFGSDQRDLEIEYLRRQLAEARAREGEIRAEERERFSALSAASKRFAASMRSRMEERRRTQLRLDAQYAVGRVLEESRDLREAAPRIFRVLAGRLGWEAGVLWTLEGDVLRCRGVWRSSTPPPDESTSGVFEEACRRSVFPPGVGLPGRVWEREEACWVEDVLDDRGYPHGEEAAAERLRCAFAFPIQDGGQPIGVFELLRGEEGTVEEDAMRAARLMGQQIGQFVERRRAEEERDRLRRLAEEGRARLHAVLQQMPGGVFIAEPGGRISLANEGAAGIYGREISSIDESVRNSLSYPENEPIRRGDHPLDRALAGETVSAEHLVERADGARSIVSANTAPVLDEDGHVVAAVEAFQDVTELVEARRAVEDREQRYRTLTTNIPGAVFRASVADGRPSMQYISARVEAITGYPAADFVSDRVRNYRDVIHPDDAPNNGREVWRALERQEPYNIEYRILRADGGVRWVNERGSGTFARGGELLWVDGAIFDVTERRRAEEALRESEARQAFLLKLGDAIRPLTDPAEIEGTVTRMLVGHLGATWSYYCPADEGTGVVEVKRDHAAVGARSLAGRYRLEDFWVTNDGTTFVAADVASDGRMSPSFRDRVLALPVHAFVSKPLVKNGRLTAFFCVGQDSVRAWTPAEVTLVEEVAERAWEAMERARAEAALRASEGRLQLALEAADMGSFLWLLEEDRTQADARLLALFGIPAEGRISLDEALATMIHPDDSAGYAEAVAAATDPAGSGELHVEIRVVHPDGAERWLAITARTFFKGRPYRATWMSGVATDITERKRAAEERDRLLAREWVASAEAAERERISRELHDRVAHSMGVAHQSLQLYDVLAQKDADRARAKLDLAKQTIKASLESTRNLSAELRRLDAEDGLEAELRHLLDVAVPPGIRSDICVEGAEADVPGHVRGQLFLMLREAVRNAVAHSGCGSLSVRLDIGPKKVVGSVQDDGRGFDGTGGNGGVGLRSMRERAALLDGGLKLEGGPGRGTRVEVCVPLVAGR